MKKRGIYGGSFYPPHLGHVRAALHFYDAMQLDELIILPAGTPPHKKLEDPFTPALRLEMTRAAFSPEAVGNGNGEKKRNILVSDYEIAAGGVSYTAKTLARFREDGVSLYLLCGSDMFLTLDSWYHPEEIFALSTPVLARREQDEKITRALLEKKAFYKEKYGKDCIFLSLTPFEISSREIREKTKRKESTDGLLPPGVARIVREKGLFGEDTVLASLREKIKERENARRAAHSLAVEEECAFLATLFPLSEREQFCLRVAALLHDITHGLSSDEQCGILRRGGFSEKQIAEALRHPRTMHQTTGAMLLEQDGDFAYIALPEVLSAIACHTTGAVEMSITAKLLCLADYIEPTRPYERCKALRRQFHRGLSEAETPEARLALLDSALLCYFEGTVEYILLNPDAEGALDPRTLASRDALLQGGATPLTP